MGKTKLRCDIRNSEEIDGAGEPLHFLAYVTGAMYHWIGQEYNEKEI
jgi:hypothetical protein